MKTQSAKRKSNNSAHSSIGDAKSLSIAERGISSSSDFRDFMSALMSDVISGRVTAQVTNAACNAGGKMLKMVQLECQYGTRPESRRRTMSLAFEDVGQALPGEGAKQVTGGDR